MRHHCATNKLGRTRAHRDAMLANMAASLIRHGRIETTLPKAKVLRGIADRMVTLGKSGTLAARRRAVAIIRDRDAVKIAFEDLAPRFAERQGGYTRILKLGWRHGDSAPMAAIEYLSAAEKGEALEKGPEGKKASVKAKIEKSHREAAKKSEAKMTARPYVEKKARFAKSTAKKTPASRAKKSGRGD